MRPLPRKRRFFRLPLISLSAVFGLASLLLAFDRKTLSTKVTANGNVIVLDWDKEHPWDVQLSSSGTSLFAEYATATHGVVIERMSAARPTVAGQRSIHLRLPDTLTAAPIGPVCLYFQVGQRILPIRKADAQADETARFRDQDWERAAVSSISAVQHQERLAQLRKAVAAVSQALQASSELISQKGWTSPASCQALQVPTFAQAEKPGDVLPASEHEEAARRVCVSRIVWGQSWVKNRVKEQYLKQADLELVQPPDVSESMLAFVKRSGPINADLRIRQSQLDRLWHDWRKWAPDASDYKQPPFGQFEDRLQIQDLSSALGEKLVRINSNGKLEVAVDQKPDPHLVAGFVGASLEAYSRCVVDGQHQLQAKLDAWNEMQARAPQLQAEARVQLVASCRKQFDDVDSLRGRKKKLEDELAAEENVPDSSPLFVSSNGVQVLNSVGCNPRALDARIH